MALYCSFSTYYALGMLETLKCFFKKSILLCKEAAACPLPLYRAIAKK
jgi:hypothetical protein